MAGGSLDADPSDEDAAGAAEHLRVGVRAMHSFALVRTAPMCAKVTILSETLGSLLDAPKGLSAQNQLYSIVTFALRTCYKLWRSVPSPVLRSRDP